MLLVAGEVALAGCDGADAVAERFDQICGATGGFRGFVRDFRLNGLADENGFGDSAATGEIGETAIERLRQFAGEHTHTGEVIPESDFCNT
jgi:hypothetical protein